MYAGMKILVEIAVKLCYNDDRQHGNKVASLRRVDYDQIRAILMCADPDDVYDAYCANGSKDKNTDVDHVFHLLHTMDRNTGFQQVLLQTFQRRLPPKREREADRVALHCWVFKKKVRCVLYVAQL